VDISFTSVFFMDTHLLIELLRIYRPDSAGPGMRCREQRKVTGFQWQKIEEIKEKSRHQICADGGDQRSTRKT
jgi:hypothetical protein